MEFLSIEFFAFLTFAVCVFYSVPPRWRSRYLLTISYLLCLVWSPASAVSLLCMSLFAFKAGAVIAVSGDKVRKLLLFSSLVFTAGTLVVFKLLNSVDNLILPLGISFYSFKLLSYLLEVYWGEEPAADFFAFLLYPAFFPQIVAGPIQRAPDFLAQVEDRFASPACLARINEGFRFILGGLLLKFVLADRLALFNTTIDGNSSAYTRTTLLLVACCYTLQLYSDFAGYSNIALGLGKLFGVDGPRNFAAPFAATNLPEMWRRWHISLTSWIADYVFMPLQMALRDLRQWGLIFSVAISMILVGIWHGLTINFFAFGAFHAFFVCLTTLTAGWRKRLLGRRRAALIASQIIGIVVTFVLMTFSQIFWHLRTWGEAADRVWHMAGLSPNGSLNIFSLPQSTTNGALASIPVILFIGAGCPGLATIRKPFAGAPNWISLACGLLLLSVLRVQSGLGFIYGQF